MAKIAVVPGDGIGKEVTAEAVKVIDAVTSSIEKTYFELGAEHFIETGETLNPETLQAIKSFDAILFGAVGGVPGDKRLAAANIERGLLLKLRFELDHYVNYRPAKLWSGVSSVLSGDPAIDFVVVREGTEGPYSGVGGALRVGTPAEVATESSINTYYGVERVVRFAFELATKRSGKLTWVHKTNVLTNSGKLWQRVVEEIGAEFPGVEVNYLHVDAATIFMVQKPEDFDVIVTDNLFGDILTDLAAAVTGGIGLAASGNMNPSKKFPSMFEPVHGSAPDIAGQQKADPTAAILSAAMLLEHLGLEAEAKRIEAAVAVDLANRGNTPRSTSEVGDAIVARILEA